MRKLIYAIVSVLVLTLINSCGLTDSKESNVHEYLKQKVISESQGALKLENFKKTNGYEQNILEIKGYIIEWQADISTQQEIWKSGNFLAGYWSNFGVRTKQPGSMDEMMMASSSKHFNKGAKIRLTGDSYLQKTEQGWRVEELSVKTSQTLGEGSLTNTQNEEPSISSIGYQNIIDFYKNTSQELTQYFMKAGWTAKNDVPYTLNTYTKNGKFFFSNNYNYKSNEYDLWNISYDMNGWTNNNNERIEFLQKPGHDNIIIYYTSKKNFEEIETLARDKFKLFNTIENTSEKKNVVYRNRNNELRFKYYAWDSYDKDQQRTRKEAYQITLLNWNDLDIIKQELCSNCLGSGETRPEGQNEYDVCAVCNGTGSSNK
jgi:hypothetical protein